MLKLAHMDAARSLANMVRDKTDSQPFSLIAIQVRDSDGPKPSSYGNYSIEGISHWSGQMSCKAEGLRRRMKITMHSESHLVELDDGSKWQIVPGDLDITLNWRPHTDLKLVRIDDEVSSHALRQYGR